jgi:hypothetical protein
MNPVLSTVGNVLLKKYAMYVKKMLIFMKTNAMIYVHKVLLGKKFNLYA